MENLIHKDCGGQIEHITYTVMPPINCRKCRKCGEEECDKREFIVTTEVELNKSPTNRE